VRILLIAAFASTFVLASASRIAPPFPKSLTISLRGGCSRPSLSPHKCSCQESSLLGDPPTYFVPAIQDLILLDLDHTFFAYEVAEFLEVEYLGPAETTIWFPFFGILYAPHRRVMVNLSCQRKNSKNTLDIIFLCDTGMLYSYSSEMAMSALIGSNDYVPNVLALGMSHYNFQLSPRDSHFAELNVLGMDFQ
jgi:hypothetical protein